MILMIISSEAADPISIRISSITMDTGFADNPTERLRESRNSLELTGLLESESVCDIEVGAVLTGTMEGRTESI